MFACLFSKVVWRVLEYCRRKVTTKFIKVAILLRKKLCRGGSITKKIKKRRELEGIKAEKYSSAGSQKK